MNGDLPELAVDELQVQHEGSLWRAFRRSVRANFFAEIASQTVRVAGFVYLARRLASADIGLLRVLIAVSLIAGIANSSGIADALIQRELLGDEHEVAGWWVNLVVALFSTAGLFMAAPLLARLLAMPQLSNQIRLICLPLFVDGTASISNARLRRRLEFSVLAKADVAAEVAFLLMALVLLLAGLPHWSLAGGLGARLLTRGLVVSLSERYLPRGLPRWSAAKDIFGFSTSVWGGRFLVALSNNFDYLLIGRLLGSSILGYYSMAWDLLRFVPDRLFSVVGRVTLPTFSRLQSHDESLRRAYCNFSNYIGRIVLPMTACTAVIAPELVTGIYGFHWRPAAIPLRILSFGLALLGLRLAIGSVYYAKNHPSFDIWLHGFRLVLIGLAIWIGAPFGLVGVSVAMSAVEGAIGIMGQVLVGRLIGLRAAALLRSWFPGFRIALACGLSAYLGARLAAMYGLIGAHALPVVAIPPATVFLLFQLPTVRNLLGDLLAPRQPQFAAERGQFSKNAGRAA